MLPFIGTSERSTHHKTTVHRVSAYLKRKCTDADYERSIAPGRVTDAVGYDGNKNTYYVCEIKVNWNDLEKAPHQIRNTISHFKPKHVGAKVVPVIAIPVTLQRELTRTDDWLSFREVCRDLGIAIWVVEQSRIVELQGVPTSNRPTAIRKAKTTRTPAKTATTKAGSTKAKAKIPSTAKSKASVKRVSKSLPATARRSKTATTRQKASRSR